MAINVIQMFKDFLASSKRILMIARKPDKKEYFAMAKVTGIGILVIGFIGFFIALIVELIKFLS